MEVTSKLHYIPEQAYLYFSKNTTPKNDDQRMIFEGNIEFTVREGVMIDAFKIHCENHNYTLKPIWTDSMILRFLYANKFKLNKTFNSVKEYTKWRETYIPIKPDEVLEKLLDSGLMYIHGRDDQFHPIIIFNFYMLEPRKVDVNLIIKAFTFLLEHVIDEWMLPGQVENWVFIVDVKGMRAGAFLHPSVRKVFKFLEDNYKCRLFKLFILNVNHVLAFEWKIIKKMINETILKKIQICPSLIPTGLLDFTNPEQVEQKYGGSANNLSTYWPPTIPSDNYFTSNSHPEFILTKDNYVSLYKQDRLKNMRIDESILEELETESEKTPKNQESAEFCKQTEDKREFINKVDEDSCRNFIDTTDFRQNIGGSFENFENCFVEDPDNNNKEHSVREFQASFLNFS